MYDVPFLLAGAVLAFLLISAFVVLVSFPKTLKAFDKKLSEFISGEGKPKVIS